MFNTSPFFKQVARSLAAIASWIAHHPASTFLCLLISTVMSFLKSITNWIARLGTLIKLFLWAGLVLFISEFAPRVIGTIFSLPVSECGAATLIFTDLLLLASVMVCMLFYQYFNSQREKSISGAEAPVTWLSRFSPGWDRAGFFRRIIYLFFAYFSVLILNVLSSLFKASMFGLWLVFYVSGANFTEHQISASGFKAIYILFALATLLAAKKYFVEGAVQHDYFSVLVLLIWAGLFIIGLTNLFYILVLFDTISILFLSLIVSAEEKYNNVASSYATQYLIISILTSLPAYAAIVIFNIHIGTFDAQVILTLASKPELAHLVQFGGNGAITAACFFLVIKAAFLFGVFPFQNYVAQLTSTGNYAFAAYFLVVAKFPLLFAIITVFNVFWHQCEQIRIFIILVGLTSILYSAFAMFNMTKIKDIFAMSSINHAGMVFVLLGFREPTAMFAATALFIIYGLASLTLILVLSRSFAHGRASTPGADSYNDVETFQDLSRAVEGSLRLHRRSSAIHAGTWAYFYISAFAAVIALATLAGFPPLAGFFGKLLLIEYFIVHHMFYGLAAFAAFSLISMVAYINVMVSCLRGFGEINKNEGKYSTKPIRFSAVDSYCTIFFLGLLAAAAVIVSHAECMQAIIANCSVFDVRPYGSSAPVNDELMRFIVQFQDLYSPETANRLAEWWAEHRGRPGGVSSSEVVELLKELNLEANMNSKPQLPYCPGSKIWVPKTENNLVDSSVHRWLEAFYGRPKAK